MTLEQMQKQAERIEGFREGYLACLNWMSAHTEQEKKEAVEKVLESAPQA